MTLGTLKWLAQALGIPRPQLSPQGLPLPVATPELSFGWSGSPALFSDNTVTNQGAGAVFATVTVPDDGFYCVDASWAYSPAASATSRVFLVRLQILDPNSKVAWQLTDFWVISVDTAVGTLFESGKQMPTMMLHLPKDAIVRWITVSAGILGEVIYGSIAMRLCYQDNM